jgi:NAD(P)-dependent dehydrogenase (short-subunit alcohol dehydrogenase family)
MSQTFGATSTTDEVLAGVDLAGKRVLVTGASAGLGVETLRAISARGAIVIGLARDLEKARSALTKAGARGVELVQGDLASLASVRKAADELAKRGKLDAIVANAGVMACPEGRTADGFETQFGTNHLGHFVLVNHLVPLLRAPARVVVLSSAAHRYADVDLDDPNFEKTPYNPVLAYGRSKTANVLYATELDRRLQARGVRVSAVHPGVIQTELARHMTPEILRQLIPGVRPGSGDRPPTAPGIAFKTIPQGAATSVWAGFTAAADAVGGRYCEDCHVAELASDPAARSGVRSYAIDSARAAALWQKSEELVGERFQL